MSIRTIASAIMALVAFLLVAFAPAGAAAHGRVPHVHAAKHVSDDAAVKPAVATQAELRAQMPALPDSRTDNNCDRGCCSAGHCSGCGTALAPAIWVGLRMAADVLRLNPDAARPAGLAFESPPRPPKSFA
jgi:hypothetical protein